MAEIRTVFVNAWAYEGGGGFDWFRTAEDADKAFADEATNVFQLQQEKWTAFRFDVEVAAGSPPGITNEIDAQLIELCAKAERRCGPLQFASVK